MIRKTIMLISVWRWQDAEWIMMLNKKIFRSCLLLNDWRNQKIFKYFIRDALKHIEHCWEPLTLHLYFLIVGCWLLRLNGQLNQIALGLAGLLENCIFIYGFPTYDISFLSSSHKGGFRQFFHILLSSHNKCVAAKCIFFLLTTLEWRNEGTASS